MLRRCGQFNCNRTFEQRTPFPSPTFTPCSIFNIIKHSFSVVLWASLSVYTVPQSFSDGLIIVVVVFVAGKKIFFHFLFLILFNGIRNIFTLKRKSMTVTCVTAVHLYNYTDDVVTIQHLKNNIIRKNMCSVFNEFPIKSTDNTQMYILYIYTYMYI